MTTRIQLRRGTAAEWTTADPTLALGESGIETDTQQWKVGDGVTIWSELPYMSGGGGTGNIGFTGDAIYDINGMIIENADLSHGATAAIILPSNGATAAVQINNTYGNITLQTGVGANVTAAWTFDNTGNLTLPSNSASINYANGQPYGGGGGGNYGNPNVATFLANFGSNNISTFGNITSSNVTSNLISGVLTAPGGNGQVMYNRSGNIGASPTDFNYDELVQTLFVKTGSFSGNTQTGINALYAGTEGFVPLGSNVMTQITGNANSYSQLNLQNIDNGTQASGDFIITANNGDDMANFIDMGIASNTWDGSQPNSLGTQVGPNDGYLYVNGGNLVATTVPVPGAGTKGPNVNITAGASDSVTWNSNPGGDLNLQGGYGSFADGGGGPGGNVNIRSGLSSDSTPGNVYINAGDGAWTFDYNGGFHADVVKANVVNAAAGNLYLTSYQNTSDTVQINTYHTVWTFDQNDLTQSNGNLSVAGNIVSGGVVVTTPLNYANLTPVPGGRAIMNNANLAAAGNFGAQVSGGGGNTVPVWSDGVNWFIG